MGVDKTRRSRYTRANDFMPRRMGLRKGWPLAISVGVSHADESMAVDWQVSGHQGEMVPVVSSPDGKAVASGREDNSVWLWDVHMGTALPTLASLD